jgi:protein O-GlcNAc transferase
MQSVFGFHDKTKFQVYVYATSQSDGSQYRQKIEEESQHFLDVSNWSTREIVERIVMDGIHLRTWITSLSARGKLTEL